MIITTIPPPPSPLKILSVLVFCHNYVYCMFTSPYYRYIKANVYEEVKIFHQSYKIEGLHIILGFFTFKNFTNAINVIRNVNAMKCQNPNARFPNLSPVCAEGRLMRFPRNSSGE